MRNCNESISKRDTLLSKNPSKESDHFKSFSWDVLLCLAFIPGIDERNILLLFAAHVKLIASELSEAIRT